MSEIAILVMFLYIFLGQLEGIVVKEYGKRHKIGGMFFNAIICAFAGVFFVIKEAFFTKGSQFHFPLELLPYGIVSCVMYAIGFYTMYRAFQLGSFGMTKLISSFSGIITIAYGVVFLRERPHWLTYIAIFLVFLSVVFMRIEDVFDGGKQKSEAKKKESADFAKWLMHMILCIVSNGFIAILSRQQQLAFNEACDSEFKMISTFGACLLLMVLGFVLEKDNLEYIVKNGSLYGAGAGLVNGAKNFLSLVIYTLAPISIFTPMSTGLGLIASFALSVFLYKEKFTKMQVLAVCVGGVAFVLFQIASDVDGFVSLMNNVFSVLPFNKKI